MNRFRSIPGKLAGLGPGAMTMPAMASVESAAGSPEACFTAPDAQAGKTGSPRSAAACVMFSGGDGAGTRAGDGRTSRSGAARGGDPGSASPGLERGVGRQQADGAAATCCSLFQAGSLAKPATVVLAAWRMQQAGAINLDADVDGHSTPWKLPVGRQGLSIR